MPIVATTYDQPDGVYVVLFEFTWDGGSVLRLTPFGGDETGAQLAYYSWGGEQWLKWPVEFSPLRESPGDLPESSVLIADPDRSVLAFVSQARPRNATLTLRLVRQSDGVVVQQVDAIRVQGWASRAGQIEIAIGSSDIQERTLPRVRLAREYCPSDYEHRFDHELLPMCSYPSDHFGLGSVHHMFQTANGPSARTEARWGWWTEKAQGAQSFAIPVTRNSRSCMNLSKSGENCKFSGTNLEALRIFKRIGATGEDEDDLVDVQAKLEINGGTTTNAEPTVGVFVQNANSEGNWVYCGFCGSGGASTCFRVTTAFSSATTTFTNSSYNAFRIKRTSASGWTFYARQETLSAFVDNTNAWTQVGTASLTMGSVLRCGIVVGGDEIPSPAASRRTECWAYHFRFLRGGLTKCSRHLAGSVGCETHKNTWAYGGVKLAPPGAFV